MKTVVKMELGNQLHWPVIRWMIAHTLICVRLLSINEMWRYWSYTHGFLIKTMSGLLFSCGMQLFMIHCVMVVLYSISVLEYYFSSDIIMFFCFNSIFWWGYTKKVWSLWVSAISQFIGTQMCLFWCYDLFLYVYKKCNMYYFSLGGSVSLS